MIIAGEASGDLHGAAVVRELKRLRSGMSFTGVGGDAMIREGFVPLVHSNKMGFLGFTEVVRHLPYITRVKRLLLSEVKKRGIGTVVLVDYPGFNLNIAKALRAMGVKVIYYISPQLWAWGKGRMKKIRERVNRMLVVFPFEEAMYREAGIAAEFVGHPLVEQLEGYDFLPREELYKKYRVPEGKDVLLLMPGSRKQEVELLLPPMLGAARTFARESNMHIVIACAPSMSESLFPSEEGISVTKVHTLDMMKIAKAGIIKSGTSTLQAGLLGLPMVVVYKTSRLTYRIGKALVSIASIGLVNIVAGKRIVPELIQDDANEEKISVALREITEAKRRGEIITELHMLREKLGSRNAAKNAAAIINGMLDAA